MHKNYESAIRRINIWSARTEKISWAIDSTRNILACKKYAAGSGSENFCQIIYKNILTSAIIRFVALAIEKLYNKHKTTASMTFLAEKLNIPEWIVEVRHECGHGEMPSLVVLEEAVDFCFGWLKEKYWELQREEYLEVSIESVLKLVTCCEIFFSFFFFRFLSHKNVSFDHMIAKIFGKIKKF